MKSKEEIAAYQKAYRQKNKERLTAYDRARKARLKAEDPAGWYLKEQNRRLKKYGLTREEFKAMFASQRGVCKLCFGPPTHNGLHIDHCHETGRVRGLLCHQCNWYLGKIDADPELLTRIDGYRRQDNDR